MQMSGCWVFLALVVLLVPTPSSGKGRQAREKEVRDEATISYAGRYEVPCTHSLLGGALDHLLVMGALWAAYGYAPTYKVSSLGESGAVHVEDPTGIVGVVWPVVKADGRRVYLAEGKLDHWAVPALNAGTAVFEMETVPDGVTTQVVLRVFVKPESRIAGAVLWMLSPAVRARIENRITLNLGDVGKILQDIEHTPRAVASRLEGDLRKKVEQAFCLSDNSVRPP